jgi:dynein heavy chain 2
MPPAAEISPLSDPRVDYIRSTIRNLIAGKDGCEFLLDEEELLASPQLRSFLEDASTTLLWARPDGKGRVHLANEVGREPAPASTAPPAPPGGVSFVKLSAEPLTEQNMHAQVLVVTLWGETLGSLQSALHEVYAPALLAASANREGISGRVQQLIADLDVSLSDTVRHKSGLRSLASICKPADEFDFWSMADDGRLGLPRGSAASISESFDPIVGNFSDTRSLELGELEELMDATHHALDGAWQSGAYPQERMSHLMDLIGSTICQVIRARLEVPSVWTEPHARARARLQTTRSALEKWTQTVEELTGVFWKDPQSSSKTWKGEPHKDLLASGTLGRMEQVIGLLSKRQELLHLLSPEESHHLDVAGKFAQLQTMNPLQYSAYGQSEWHAAVAELDRSLAPVEGAAASTIRRNVASLREQPALMLREMGRYGSLLRQQGVRNALSGERQALMGQLSRYLGTLEGEMESEPPPGGGAPKHLSPRVASIVHYRQMAAKCSSLLSAAEAALADVPGFDAFRDSTKDLIRRSARQGASLFEEWKEDVEERLDADELLMQGKLMEISSNGSLVVTYSERLVTLLREVRQLSELGHPISGAILKAAAEGERYYRHGVTLRKVATFYNSIESQVIDSQRPMLLDALLAFEEVVTNPTLTKAKGGDGKGGAVTWSSPVQCEQYTSRLRAAAEGLGSENRRLRQVHAELSEKVCSLMRMDLLRQREQWRSGWEDIRSVVSRLEARYPRDRMRRWIAHWDAQVYKALEAGYQMGLESLNENLPELKAELTVTSRTLRFKPPVEELRSTYYREMKRFVAIPSVFDGLDRESKLLYRQMAPRNSRSLLRVYEMAESIFQRLADLQQQYVGWVVLGTVDLDAYVEEHVDSVEAYEANFRMIKEKRRGAERLPELAKIDCINVSIAPLKTAVDDQLQRLEDTLLLSLRKRILGEFREVDVYLQESMESLARRPSSVMEMSTAKKDLRAIEEGRDAARATSARCEAMKRLLLSQAPGSAVDVSEVASKMAGVGGEGGRWDEMDIAAEAFREMLEGQKEELKGVIEQEVVELNRSVEKFGGRWKALKPTEMKVWTPEAVSAVFSSLEDWEFQFKELRGKADVLYENCASFDMPPPRFEGIDVIAEDMKAMVQSWGMYREYSEELGAMASTDWIGFRSNVFALQDLAIAWDEKITKQMAETQKADVITEKLRKDIERIKKGMPCLKYCRGDPFKEEHWSALLQGKLGLDRTIRLENLTVGHFIGVMEKLADPNLLQFVKHLQARAQGEVTIREALQELVAWGQTAELKLLEHELDGRKTMLIRDWKDLFVDLGDKQSLLGSLKESQFFKAFEDTGTVYEAKLGAVDSALHMLNSIQRKWLYLEPIFGRGALPMEAVRFRRVDEDFRDIMAKLALDPKLLGLADDHVFPGLDMTLTTALDQLERCQKALSEFLEEKRSAMPRFYFIGDDDLLEMLGQARNPGIIQAHLKKLFQGIHSVEMSSPGDKCFISAMLSSAGEVVPLENPVAVTDRVEDWLDSLATEMKSTLASLLGECLSKSELEKYPSQILCVAEQIRFADQVEAAIKGGDLKAVGKSLAEMLSQYTAYDLSARPLMQSKVKSLVLDVVHFRDIVEQLRNAGVKTIQDWAWQKQLRYGLPANGPATISMSDASFDYTYEYQGNAPRLVYTPLTDKCYLTLTQGMHMGFGGNPYGPAGTGKTESVKALGQAMGRQVLVFNCDEGIDFQSMGRIFIGLVKCGAWGCFDEFNRLKEDQLSAVSQQIQVIQDAIKARSPTLSLLGRDIHVDCNAGIFVTLNPAGKGYGGRSKLPDNLKALFRPVAMGRPDNELIAEVLLYSEGFSAAHELACKIVSLFSLSQQLLSPQQHYDWGLRALKAVLNTAGKLRRESRENETSQLELELLIKAVRVNTLSKLTYNDTGLFLALIGDVFPGVQSNDISGGELEAAIRDVMPKRPFGLEVNDAQIHKMLQLKEALDQRMGCVVVGPSGCGKSTVWSVLRAALQQCGQAVVTHVMNPKSMPRQRLLGSMDVDTREWTDGVLTAAARKVVNEPAGVRSWIICDGDVDPEWIESLNSVLDDNHLLTLPNGERINFGPDVNFLFETHDLQFASPATISRMGMIFLSDKDVDVRHLVTRWICGQAEDKQAALNGWIDDYFYRALDHVLSGSAGEPVVDTTMVGTVMNGLSQVSNAVDKSEFVCGLVRGLGGNLSHADRATFAKEIFNWANERLPDPGSALDCHPDGRGGFAQHLTFREVAGGVVKTASVLRTLDTMRPWLVSGDPFLLVGPEGCGKDMMVRYALQEVARGGPSSEGGRRALGLTVLHCSAQTTADHVISKISQSCSLYSTPDGRAYRPRDCERLLFFLKDINLPKPDQYGTCMLIAFLRQLLTFGGFYDENLEFLKLERVQIVACMSDATTVGRHPLSARFTASVRIGVLDYPDGSELTAVCDTMLGDVLKRSPPGDPRWSRSEERGKLARMLVDVYTAVRGKFNVDEERHYLFTPRDLVSWVRGLLRYDMASTAGDEVLDCIAYEGSRLFRDRLVNHDTAVRFDSLLAGQMRAAWRHSGPESSTLFSTLTQGMRATGNGGAEGHRLLRVDAGDLMKPITQGLMYYEREERDLGMLLFPEMLARVAQVDRILSAPGGHLLLVGRSGVGRRQVTTLAAYMQGFQIRSPAITRDFDLKQFGLELKAAMQIAGVDGSDVLLYLEDHQLTDDTILETVNSLLSGGEVPGLWGMDELDPLLAPLKEQMMEDGRHRTVYEYFVARVMRHLHVAISMDPTHPQFTARCEANPALYTRCGCLWFGDWGRASVSEVPRLVDGAWELMTRGDSCNSSSALHKSSEQDGKYDSDNEGKDHHADVISHHISGLPSSGELLGCAVKIRQSVNDTTPLEYVSFLRTWVRLHAEKERSLQASMGRLSAGLGKLEEASATVDELRSSAARKQKELQAAQVAADHAMDQITTALSEATVRRGEVEVLKKDLAENKKETQERKGAIEQELGEIQPVLDAAKEAVGGITSDNLNEIRSLKMPPEPIADVLGAVLMLLGIHDTSWLSMKKFLGARGVKDDILNYDAHRITPELRAQVGKVLKQKASSFEHANIYRVSLAAAPLAAWVKANIRYSIVLEKILPLEENLAEAVSALDKAQARLRECEEELGTLDARVRSLKEEFGARTREAENLRVGLERAQATLDKAQNLIGQLGGERERWRSQSKSLENELVTLPLQMMLAAGFVTYLGGSPESVRAATLGAWIDIVGEELGSKAFHFKRMLSTESQLLVWKGDGLPADELSQENGLVLENAGDRVPFIVDPASAATRWLKTYLAADASRPLDIVSCADARFVSHVELAVRFGKTLLALEADGLEPLLYPLARRDLVHQGPRHVVYVGDKVLDFNDGFRLILVTRNPSPNLPPSAAALVCEINFTVTRSGLCGQLLGVTIQHEQPEVEKARSELLAREEDFKVQLSRLEAELLEALATAEGDLLENTALLESLTKTKVKAKEIEDALHESAAVSEELDRQRDVYAGFAKDGSTLYFIVEQLSALNPMYRFSLTSFIGLFEATLDDESLVAVEGKAVEVRLARLTPALELRVLHYIGRSLFKGDRMAFATHMVRGMHPEHFGEGEGGDVVEWGLFTRMGGYPATAGGSSRLKDVPPWLPDDCRADLEALAEASPRLAGSLTLSDTSKWQRWMQSPEPEHSLPQGVRLRPFEKLLLIQALRPDRLQSAVHGFVCDSLRVSAVSPPAPNLASIAVEATAGTPILICITTGADPSKELEELAERTVGAGRYATVAMGGGQQARALALINAAAQSGDWICLKNLHLVSSWLPTLEKELAGLSPHENFRLWLTTEATPSFPPALLQCSLKLTFESPPGLKKNLQRTYGSIVSPELVEGGGALRAQMLFALAAFHAVVQERCTYCPQGWTKSYEFSIGDLRAGAMVVGAAASAASTSGQVDWLAVRGLMEDAVYGGRVDCPPDLKIMSVLLNQHFCDNIAGVHSRGGKLLGISLPGSDRHADYVSAISTLPDNDAPEVFSLPANIERSIQRSASERLLRQLRMLMAISASASRFDRELWRTRLSPFLETWEKLTASIPDMRRRASARASPAAGSLGPVVAFVAHESAAALEICSAVDASLSGLKNLLYGSGLLTPALQEIGSALTRGDVPASWSKRWEGPEAPADWLSGLMRRKLALNKWVADSTQGQDALLGRPLNLADLFNPHTFLNAVRQATCRASGSAMDGLKLACAWDVGRLPSAPISISVVGLQLQGAALEGGLLREPAASDPDVILTPPLLLAYVPKESASTYPEGASLEVPLYFAPNRERLLVNITMPTDDDPAKWTLAGCGLFLSAK